MSKAQNVLPHIALTIFVTTSIFTAGVASITVSCSQHNSTIFQLSVNKLGASFIAKACAEFVEFTKLAALPICTVSTNPHMLNISVDFEDGKHSLEYRRRWLMRWELGFNYTANGAWECDKFRITISSLPHPNSTGTTALFIYDLSTVELYVLGWRSDSSLKGLECPWKTEIPLNMEETQYVEMTNLLLFPNAINGSVIGWLSWH